MHSVHNKCLAHSKTPVNVFRIKELGYFWSSSPTDFSFLFRRNDIKHYLDDLGTR